METSNAAVNSGSAIGTAAAGAMATTQYSAFMNRTGASWSSTS